MEILKFVEELILYFFGVQQEQNQEFLQVYFRIALFTRKVDYYLEIFLFNREHSINYSFS